MYNVILWSLITKIGKSRTYMNLDTLSHTLRNLHIMLTCHILLYVRCKFVTSHTDRVVAHDTTERDYGNLSRTTTYIHDHVSFWSFYIHTDTDSSSHRLEDKIYITSIGMLGRVTHSTKLNLSRTRRHTNDHTQRRREEMTTGMNHSDKSAHHLLTCCEIGNHTILQRTDSTDIIVCLLVHTLGTVTYGNHLVGATVKCHYRRLVNYNLIITDDDCVCRTKVHGYFLYKREKSHFIIFELRFTNYFVLSNQALIAVS